MITSPANQTIKDLVRLKDRKGEKSEQCFVVEGAREITRAVECGFKLTEIYVCQDLLKNDFSKLLAAAKNTVYVSPEAFQKVAVREKSDGLLGVFLTQTSTLYSIHFKNNQNTLVIAVEGVEKPGNLGAVLRSADAAGVDAVIVLDQTVDPWNQHVIRASLGGVFSVPVVVCSSQDFLQWCKLKEIKVIGAALSEESKSVYKTDLTAPCAIVFGSEAHGLSEFVLKGADELSMIPMPGVCDSLNISVAASVYMFEAVRQRQILVKGTKPR